MSIKENELAKILSCDFTSVELLKPIHSQHGAKFLFYVQHQAEKIDVSNIIAGEIANQRLNNVKLYVWDIDICTHSVQQLMRLIEMYAAFC